MYKKVIKITFFILLVFCLEIAISNSVLFKISQVESVSFGKIKEIDKNKPEEIDNKIVSEHSPITQINFVGDIMLARSVERMMDKNGGDYPFRKISFSEDEEFTIANFEASIPETHIPTPDNTFRFSVDSKKLTFLKQTGITHLSLANNHSFDFGLPGYNNSITTLWNYGFIPFGHPTILSTSSVTVIDVGNNKVAIIAIHTLYKNFTPENIKEVIDYANEISNLQIVYIHWGDEYSAKQSESQRKFASLLAEYGVDIIVGHHPHVVQGIEKINNTLVIYSLGNFIFDQYFSVPVQNGLMLKLTLDEKPALALIPVATEKNRAQPEVVEGSNKDAILNSISERSSLELSEFIKSGSIPISFTLASSTKIAIMAE